MSRKPTEFPLEQEMRQGVYAKHFHIKERDVLHHKLEIRNIKYGISISIHWTYFL